MGMDTRLYNPVYGQPTILLFGMIFFGLAAKVHGRIMAQEQGAIEASRGSNDGYSGTCRKAEDKGGY